MVAPILAARAALLQALVIPGYGLALIDRVRRVTGGRVRLRIGSVYPALRALEHQGLVRCDVVRPTGGAGRPKKYYELSLAGVAAATSEREALAGLLRTKGIPPSTDDLSRMRERLRRCGSLSKSILKLRDTMLAMRNLA